MIRRELLKMDLLDEIWSLIFREHLPFLDAVRCRRVSKRFKFLIDQLRPAELFIYAYTPASCFTYRYESESTMWMQLRKWDFYLESNSSFQIVFANLKFLQLEKCLNKKFNLEFFNEFVQLEKLYLNLVVISRSQTLKLFKLKVLSIKLVSDNEHECRYRYGPLDYDREPRLTVDCKLEELLGARSSLFQMNHPECIRHLERDPSHPLWPSEMQLEQLILFKNLRILHSRLTETILAAFPFFEHLQELHLDRYEKTANYQLINQLLSKRHELKRATKIYFTDILVTKSGQLIGCGKLHKKIRFYHQLADCVPREIKIDYSELEIFLNESDVLQRLRSNQIELNRRLPADFFDKFPNLKYVSVSKIDDIEWLAWFLSKCRRLTELSFERVFLTQPVLNRLPVAGRNLKNLSITDYRPRSHLNNTRLDLSPLYKLKQLISIKLEIDDTNPDTSFDLGIILEKCWYLVEVCLKYISISVNKDSLYDVYTYRGVGKPGNVSCLSNLRETCRYEELKANLNSILQECRDFQESWEKRRNKLRPLAI